MNSLGYKNFFPLVLKGITLHKGLISNGSKQFSGVKFYKYKRLGKSCDYSQAMVDMPKLTRAVISAIEELHSCGIAHLDIRLDNICFKDEDDLSTAILIDLDRSKSATSSYCGDANYKKSCMYAIPEKLANEHVTNSMMDWVQLGYMLIWILLKHAGVAPDSYHAMQSSHLHKLNVSSECRGFLSHLICLGKF